MVTLPSESETFTHGNARAIAYLNDLKDALDGIPLWQVAKAGKYILRTHLAGGTVFCAGNGGSQANAAHLSLHLQERGIRSIDMLGEGAIHSALANDYTYEGSLAKRLRLLAKPEDLLVVVSGSGNSLNLVAALAEARRLKVSSVALLGFGGGMAASMARVPIVLRCQAYGPVEDTHSAIIHMIAGNLGDTGHGPALAR